VGTGTAKGVPSARAREGEEETLKIKGRYGKSEQRPRKKSERATTLMMFFALFTIQQFFFGLVIEKRLKKTIFECLRIYLASRKS
jgi:hypothetical protein